MGKTSIEWTDESSNPLRYRTADGRTVWACVKVSPGCANCYSAALSERFTQRQAGPYNLRVMQGLTPYLDEKEMRRLLTSKVLSGKRVFMCDMTDLFGEWVPDEMIAAVFGVMAARPDVTFQVLTKHAERMARWFALHAGDDARMAQNVAATAVMRAGVSSPTLHLLATGRTTAPVSWPPPNVWIGASVEDQERADERIPHLLSVPAAVRFLSVEPMLEAIDLRLGPYGRETRQSTAFDRTITQYLVAGQWTQVPPLYRAIDWLIVGGESGPGARPFDLAWAVSLSEQCRAAGVPYFFKQAGAAPVDSSPPFPLAHGTRIDAKRIRLADKGGDVDELARLFPDLAAAGVFRREWPAVPRAS